MMKYTMLTALCLLAAMRSDILADVVSLPPQKDNTLYEDSVGQLSNGQGIYFFDGKTGANLLRRGLIAFDLASIPSNATITGATLSMFLSQASGGSQAVSLSKVLRNWGEGASDAGDPGGGGIQAETSDATWLHTFYDTNFWTTPGGDFSATPSATTTVSAVNTTYTWSGSGLLADVQAWISDPASNFGWIIRGNEITMGRTQRFNSSEHSSNPPQLTVTYQVPTPTPGISISGTISYCSKPIPGPVPDVTLTLTGTIGGSTLSDGSGNYTFSVPSGGNYAVTPTKAPLALADPDINTVDVIAIQRHLLNLGTPFSGCRLAAADVNGVDGVNTVDVIAVQRFAVAMPTGTANTGQYHFTPANRSYLGLGSDQTAQNYDTLIFGDVASPFAERLDGASPSRGK